MATCQACRLLLPSGPPLSARLTPPLLSARPALQGGAHGPLDGCHLLLEYCDLLDLHPTPWRMVKGHAFQMLGG